MRPWLQLALPDENGGGGAASGDGAGAGGGAGAAGAGAAGQQGGAGAGQSGQQGAAGGQQSSGDDDDQFKTLDGKKSALADLASERDKRQAAEARVAELEAATQTQEQRDAAAREQQGREAAENARIRHQYEAAETAGLPLSWARRISGATPEEMAEDAKRLKTDVDAMAASKQTTPGVGVTGAGDQIQTSPGLGTVADYYARQGKK